MSAEPAPDEPPPIGITDDDVDEAILACGGDVLATIKALLIAGQFLEQQLQEARREASGAISGLGRRGMPAMRRKGEFSPQQFNREYPFQLAFPEDQARD